MTQREHLHLILYELSLGIGNSVDLTVMLEQSLSCYLRKLNCSAVGILKQECDEEGYRTFGLLHSIPRSFRDSKLEAIIRSRIPALDTEDIWQRFRRSLPIEERCIDGTVHLMCLGDRDLLFLVSKHEAMDTAMVKSLIPLNEKLAAAIEACEQRQALEASESNARDEQNRLKTFMDTVQAGILVMDANTHEIIEANPAALRMIGTSREKLVGNACSSLICPRPKGQCPVTDLGQEVQNAEQVLLTASGESLPVLRTVNRITLSGRDLLLESMVDISEQKQIEDELRRANKAAKAANKAKSEFLANVSHEIRTPMTAVLGFTDVLLDGLDKHNLPAHKLKAAKTIHKNGRHLLNLINDILDLSKIDSGSFAIDPVLCSPRRVIGDVVSLFDSRTHDKGLAFLVDIHDRIPDTVVTDPIRLRQILINILGNAVKFTDTGNVTLTCSFEAHSESDGELVFHVTDTGIGMTTSQAERLFQPFSQVDTSSTRRFGGSGLGLAISRRLARALGGDVELVESAPDIGSHFCIRIRSSRQNVTGPRNIEALQPALNIEGVESCNGSDIRSLQNDKPLKDAVILLAEDGEDNQDYFSYVLRQAGAEVDVVGNGQLAVYSVLGAPLSTNTRGIAKSYDVVLMDMQMPILDGYRATALLRKHGYKGTIIALTAHAMASDRSNCIKSGCDDYVSKPVDRGTLYQVIQRYLPVHVPAHSYPARS